MPNISDSFNFPGNFIDARSQVQSKDILDGLDKDDYPIGFEVFVIRENKYYTLISTGGNMVWTPRQTDTNIGIW